jgi:pyridinium-3,5-bisthiocarboxylic acid mononucleotide nickel chelatase
VVYFDCFSGISGDMALGACLDAGLPLEELKRALGSLALGDAHVHATRVLRTGVAATKFNVHEHRHDQPAGHSHPDELEHSHSHSHDHGQPHDHARGFESGHGHRSLGEIFSLIDGCSLSPTGRARAKAMFQRLAEAEAAIHRMPVEQVHLHEVGALDSIIDVVGIVFAMEWLAADRVVCSPLNVGGGTVQSAHGLFPVPAPATVSLLGDAPIYSGAVQKELVTPTGALIATTLVRSRRCRSSGSATAPANGTTRRRRTCCAS